MSVRDLIILGCSSQQPTRYRNHSGYLFRWNNEGLLIDPGEGTQRQFIYANVAPTVVTRIFISHFHGDHCLGLGSMLMRLNLDNIQHTIHCYYPASGKKYFDRLRYGTIYHERIKIIEHPVSKAGLVHKDENFCIEATFLDHIVENIGWSIFEHDQRKFYSDKLEKHGVFGSNVRYLKDNGYIDIKGKRVFLDDVSWIRKGDRVAIVIDTRYCQNAINIAQNATLFLCESTYLEDKKELAYQYYHLTAKEAATIAKKALVQRLVLTHFSARYQSLTGFAEEAKSIFPNVWLANDLKTFPLERRLNHI